MKHGISIKAIAINKLHFFIFLYIGAWDKRDLVMFFSARCFGWGKFDETYNELVERPGRPFGSRPYNGGGVEYYSNPLQARTSSSEESSEEESARNRVNS